MRSESLQESLSALMDGEAGEMEVRRVLQATEQDPAVRGTWERYQVARAVMHKEAWQGKIDLSAGISAALANEPAVSAPQKQKQATNLWQTVGKFAVAASVTVAVLVGVRMVNDGGVPGDTVIVADRAAQEQAPVSAPAAAPSGAGSAVLAGFPATSEAGEATSEWHEERIGTYLRRHAEQGTQAATPTLVPHARAASLDDK